MIAIQAGDCRQVLTAVREHCVDAVGDPEYVEMARKRIAHWAEVAR